MKPADHLSLYAARRRRLAELMGEGVAVIATAPEKLRNRDSHYPYRFDSYFYYLTGFLEPEAALVLVAGKSPKALLFCRHRDPEREIWDGFRYGPEAAKERFGFDEAHPIGALDEMAPKLLEDQPALYYPVGAEADWDARVMRWLNVVRARARAGIAAAAHRRAMQSARPGRMEYEIEAELLHEFRRNGAQFPAYSPIVATGANACVLHYISNDARLADGDLLLIDAGCELDGYASDITRTFPVSGRFSGGQRAVYDLVLAAQRAAIEKVKSGNAWNEPHDAAVRVLAQGLLDLKLLSGSLDEVLEKETYKRFYMHRTGHWLGLDVHDAGEYKRAGNWRSLAPGMALTVEPGLYIRAADDVPEPFRNIGVRIEDDVVVTPGGCEVITAEAPKGVAEIEALMRDARPRD